MSVSVSIGRPVLHGVAVAVVVVLAAAGVAVVGVALSFCGFAGGRCEPDELAAADAAYRSAVVVVVAGAPAVWVSVREARWRVSSSCALLVIGLALLVALAAAA